jgi:hypothetical protein
MGVNTDTEALVGDIRVDYLLGERHTCESTENGIQRFTRPRVGSRAACV